MTLPSPEEIESAIEDLKQIIIEDKICINSKQSTEVTRKFYGRLVKMKETVLTILSALKSGELVKPASEEKIGNIISKECWQNIDKDLKLSKDWIKNVAKALSGKVGELVGKGDYCGIDQKKCGRIKGLEKQLQSKYMSVEEVEWLIILHHKDWLQYHHPKDGEPMPVMPKDFIKKLAQALTRLPKGEI